MKKKISICILIIILILVIILGIRVVKNQKIFKEIQTTIDDILESGNFTYEAFSKEMNTYKKWIYNNEKIAFQQGNNNNKIYVDMKSNIVYAVNFENNTYSILDSSAGEMLKPEYFSNAPQFFVSSPSKMLKVGEILLANITEDTIDNIECYKIELFGEIAWINKESLMPLKAIRDNVEYTYNIVLNDVLEQDVVFDIENFKENI